MSHPTFAAAVLSVQADSTIPDRIAESGLWELSTALGGREGEDVWASLSEAMSAMSLDDLGEKLLDLVLLQPPIPAGCSALLTAMQDPDAPPWVDHEVPSDRFWLWYVHHVVHRALPEQFPAPAITRVTFRTTMMSDVRPPGKRSAPRDRTRFAARVLSGRPGSHPLAAGRAPTETDWEFDVVWHATVEDRRRATAEDFDVAPADPASRFVTTMSAWLAPQWLGDLAADQHWTVDIGD